MRNRDCSRRGRGGGSDSGRGRIWDRDRYRSKIGTDWDTDRDTKRGTNKAGLRLGGPALGSGLGQQRQCHVE